MLLNKYGFTLKILKLAFILLSSLFSAPIVTKFLIKNVIGKEIIDVSYK